MSSFSEEVMNRVQKDFLEMTEQRGQWVREDQITLYIQSAPWNAGSFIRKEFRFSAWIKKGREYFYSKKDLVVLGEELTKRNIDLKRYRELLRDRASFEKKIVALKKQNFQKAFQIPKGLRNMVTGEIKMPDPNLVYAGLARLKHEFEIAKLGGYIDIYPDRHAMLKRIECVEKYLEPGLRRRCRKWCDEFNYAQHALELITKNEK